MSAATTTTTTPQDGAVKPVLLLRTVQSTCFRTLWETLKEILVDVTLNFNAEGVRLNAIDGSRVSLIHLKLDAFNFEDYYCPKPVSVGVNTMAVYRLLKSLSNRDCISWQIDADDTNVLKLLVDNAERNYKTCYSLKLLDLDEQVLRIPDLTQKVSIVNMPSNEFQKFVRDMNGYADTVNIRMTHDRRLVMQCEGYLASQTTVLGESRDGIQIQEPGTLTTHEEKNHDEHEYDDMLPDSHVFDGHFSLKYLTLFVKATNLSNTCELLLRKNYPLILRYSVASLGTIIFCLAGRCEDQACVNSNNTT